MDAICFQLNELNVISSWMDEWCLLLDGVTIQLVNNKKTHKLEATHFLKFS